MIKVDPQDGDSPITFNVDPKALFPQFEQEIQETKEDFLLRSVIATTIIILLSSVCTYFLTKKTLTPLQKLTSEVSQIQAQNLSTQLASDSSSNQTALKTGTTVLNSIQDSRDSLSGVSLDEEATNMMAYVSAYNAASRLMTALDEVLNTLISNTGA